MNTDFESELNQLLAKGKKIAAIKLYREQTGASLKDAKDAVEALEQGESLPSFETRSLGTAHEEVLSLIEQVRKIEAIKLFRERTGAGLKEAKEAVEAMAVERGIAPKSGCLGMILVALLVLSGFLLDPSNFEMLAPGNPTTQPGTSP